MCGLRLDNSVECWGSYEPMLEPDQDITYLLPPRGEFESISVGVEDYACGLRPGGEVECWSKVLRGEAGDANGPPEGEKFIQVEVGWGDACGVRVDNTLSCWWRHFGDNYSEELNLLENVLQLEIVREEACALFVDGTVQCFFGPLRETESPPGLTSLSVGLDHACGLRPGGEVECWGSDEYGKASPPEGEFTEVAASVDFTCGLRPSGEVECWGGGAARWHSKVVPPREPLVFIDAGWAGVSSSTLSWGYSCGLREDGSLLCWGFGPRILEYDGLFPPEGVFVDVGVGNYYACALSITKEVKCWGWWRSGDYFTYGEKHGRVERFDSLEVGLEHACGLKSNGTVECWDLHTEERVLPAPTDHNGGERRYSYISVGSHVCGVRTGTDAVVDCWGNDPLEEEDRPLTDEDYQTYLFK